MFATILSRLFGRSNDTVDENVVGGSDAVFQAILEHADGGKRYVVEFGEPELVNRGGEFSTNYMTRIPTFTAPGDPEPPNLEYEIPDGGIEDGGDSQLFDLLDLYEIEVISDLGDLEGETVMATFENGVLTFQFDEIQQVGGGGSSE